VTNTFSFFNLASINSKTNLNIRIIYFDNKAIEKENAGYGGKKKMSSYKIRTHLCINKSAIKYSIKLTS
jgi:hypothetical protein